MPIKVTILDDHPLVIGGLVSMLQLYSKIRIIGTYTSGPLLLESLAKNRPNILLLDIQMPEMSGHEVAAIVAKQYPDIKMIALTTIDNVHQMKNMMKSGCKGYLLKSADPHLVLEAIENVIDGKIFIDQSIQQQLLNGTSKTRPQAGEKPQLTRREIEVLRYMVDELTSQEIADKLFLSLRTVQHHRFSVMQKLGVKNTAGAIKAALQWGLVD